MLRPSVFQQICGLSAYWAWNSPTVEFHGWTSFPGMAYIDQFTECKQGNVRDFAHNLVLISGPLPLYPG